jgi:hypothetical protein
MCILDEREKYRSMVKKREKEEKERRLSLV